MIDDLRDEYHERGQHAFSGPSSRLRLFGVPVMSTGDSALISLEGAERCKDLADVGMSLDIIINARSLEYDLVFNGPTEMPRTPSPTS